MHVSPSANRNPQRTNKDTTARRRSSWLIAGEAKFHFRPCKYPKRQNTRFNTSMGAFGSLDGPWLTSA
jgi:hypothetical protein